MVPMVACIRLTNRNLSIVAGWWLLVWKCLEHFFIFPNSWEIQFDFHIIQEGRYTTN